MSFLSVHVKRGRDSLFPAMANIYGRDSFLPIKTRL
jgi:hypothetical protein